MDNFIDTLTTVAATAVDLACEHLRWLLGVIVSVVVLVGAHATFQHMVAAQAAQQVMFDQLTKPAARAQTPAHPDGVATLRAALGD